MNRLVLLNILLNRCVKITRETTILDELIGIQSSLLLFLEIFIQKQGILRGSSRTPIVVDPVDEIVVVVDVEGEGCSFLHSDGSAVAAVVESIDNWLHILVHALNRWNMMRIENTLRSLLGLENRFLFLFNRLSLHAFKSTANGIREHKENFSVEVAILSVRPSELILSLIVEFLVVFESVRLPWELWRRRLQWRTSSNRKSINDLLDRKTRNSKQTSSIYLNILGKRLDLVDPKRTVMNLLFL